MKKRTPQEVVSRTKKGLPKKKIGPKPSKTPAKPKAKGKEKKEIAVEEDIDLREPRFNDKPEDPPCQPYGNPLNKIVPDKLQSDPEGFKRFLSEAN